MTVYLYFSLIPEALIASNLPPEKFGQYYATGSGYKSKGQCLFFEVDPSFRCDYFDIQAAIDRCVPAADGTPKHSVYISVYRVLEHLPVSALNKLYLSTAYGHTLGLERGELAAETAPGLHLYQDLAPVNSLVVSNLEPTAFYESVTSKPSKYIRFPGLHLRRTPPRRAGQRPGERPSQRPALPLSPPFARGLAGAQTENRRRNRAPRTARWSIGSIRSNSRTV